MTAAVAGTGKGSPWSQAGTPGLCHPTPRVCTDSDLCPACRTTTRSRLGISWWPPAPPEGPWDPPPGAVPSLLALGQEALR